MDYIPKTGAFSSPVDNRDYVFSDNEVAPNLDKVFEFDLSPTPVRMQFKIGTCTAEAIARMAEKLHYERTGVYVKLSTAFLYLVTKQIIEKNIYEGAYPRNALKAAQKYGICPESDFPTNYNMTHAEFVAQQIPEKAWKSAEQYKIGKYYWVTKDSLLIRAALKKYGALYARFAIGKEWWTAKDGRSTWAEDLIDPLRAPEVVESGHMVLINGYDANDGLKGKLANSWSEKWNKRGYGTFLFEEWDKYLTELWAITLEPVDTVDNSPVISDSVVLAFMALLRKLPNLFK
jgi:C1A family cysteine protease